MVTVKQNNWPKRIYNERVYFKTALYSIGNGKNILAVNVEQTLRQIPLAVISCRVGVKSNLSILKTYNKVMYTWRTTKNATRTIVYFLNIVENTLLIIINLAGKNTLLQTK